jgi:CelD/BcsL family acetyltransferase involved in cellulose biosynthesis
MLEHSPYQIERLETLAQLDTLEKEWTDLIAEIPTAPVFLTWEWVRTWWLHFGQSRELWLLTARDQEGNLLGIAPLMKELHRTGLVKLRILAFIGTSITYSVHLNILTHSSDPEGLMRAFVVFLLERVDQWDVIRLAPVAEGSGLFDALASTGGLIRTGTKKTSAYIPLPGDWDTYHKTLTKKLRRNLKYFRSKLDHDYPGAVSFNCIKDAQQLPAAMKKLEELNKNRWHAKDRASNYDHPGYSDFHQAIANQTFEQGWLRLNQLVVSDHVIAICYNFLYHSRIYAYAIGYDLDWSGYSPGRLAIAFSIQAAIEDAAYEYDWLGGEEAYKLAWTDQIRVEDEILFSSKWIGRFWIQWRYSWGVVREILIAKGRQWLPQSTRNRINQLLAPRYKKSGDREDKETE